MQTFFSSCYHQWFFLVVRLTCHSSSKIISPLLLHFVLQVPHISSNLFSVHRLCFDNSGSIKFFLSCFLVKNLDSKKIMLYSLVEYHLCKLYPRKFLEKNQISSSLMLHLAATSNFDIWHNRFGHPHVILSKVLNLSNPFSWFFFHGNVGAGLSEEYDTPARLLENKSSTFAKLEAEYTEVKF